MQGSGTEGLISREIMTGGNAALAILAKTDMSSKSMVTSCLIETEHAFPLMSCDTQGGSLRAA